MRKLTILLTGLLLALLAFTLPALAAPAHKAVFVIGQKSYTVDGQAKTMDAAPFTENGRTYVPVRYLALALGVAENDIIWVGSTGDVSLKLEDKLVQMKVGSRVLYVNGQAKQMDVAPLVRNGRTYLPARWVAEAFGYVVGWDEKARAVTVYPPGQEPPEVKPPVEQPKPPVEPPKPPVQPPVAGKVSLKDMPVLSDTDLNAMGIKKVPLVKEWLSDLPEFGFVYPVDTVGYKVGSREVTLWNYTPPSGRAIIINGSRNIVVGFVFNASDKSLIKVIRGSSEEEIQEATKDLPIGNGMYMRIVKPGDYLPRAELVPKYHKKWTATLSAPLAVKGNSGDTAFVVTSVLEAFGIPKECWHWDDKNQVLTMRAADDPTGNYGPKDPADRVRYIQIQAGTPHIKWVFENGRVQMSDNRGSAPYLKDGRLIWPDGQFGKLICELHFEFVPHSNVDEPKPETDNLPTLYL
ncbi:copper amine oxidase N-terminal domain-containing protein [Desulfofundulus thermocisternus]|uniref:copper amine oxidase N-terminal domain-containing protein n=1 Tax=Desulfofundulus thermocisternus TaxID=42471 RepID=UPI00217DF83B|nr:copper amine oxidase N-terminal domain-containing protein [Desulfofundulus thermocisternus]MCS5694609.1 copper amine oxidase N-terminal domain-containing protein [Desulfofundulus thermocisternus]